MHHGLLQNILRLENTSFSYCFWNGTINFFNHFAHLKQCLHHHLLIAHIYKHLFYNGENLVSSTALYKSIC